jgi:cyclic-di-GMP-binding protein
MMGFLPAATGSAMTEQHPRSGFTLPPRHPADAGSFAHRTPEHLDTWIGSQQTGDLASTATVLLEALRSINRMTIEYTMLAGLTAVFLARIPPILDQIDAHLRQLPIPLGRKTQTLATAYSEVLQELALTCLRLLDDGLEQRRLPAPDAAPLLRRAMLLNGHQCLHSWRLYQSLPEGTWLQMHQILALAERLGVASEPALETTHGHALSPDSVERLAACIAVLSSTGVYALRHGEIGPLARWLQSVPLQCSEQVPAGANESTPLLRLVVDADRAPSLVIGYPGTSSNTRFVDLGPVLTAIRSGPAGGGQPGWHPFDSGLDRRLLSLWVTPPQRRYSREPTDTGPIITVTGLQDIHALVRADYRHQRKVAIGEISGIQGGLSDPVSSGPGQIPAAFSVGIGGADDAQQFSLQVDGAGSRSKDDPHFLSDHEMDRLSAAWNAAVSGIDPRPAGAGQPPMIRMLRPTAARMRDLGAGGLRLVLQSPTKKIFSGDLIAIRTARKEQVFWQLGMIRWLCYEDADNIAVGIQYLAPACVPTDIQLYRGNRPSGQAQPGLFFPRRDKPDTGTLVFAPGAFGAGTRVVFRVKGEEQVVKLEAVQPESHTFSRADFPMPAPSRT